MPSETQISETDPDWSREAIQKPWDPGRKLLRAVRRYQALKNRSGILSKICSNYWVLNHWFWSLMTQSEIHLHMPIGGGLLLPHPTGIILHPEGSIGPNCLIFQQVTLAGPVTIGGHVDIGAGAKILGPLRIGNHARIGANAVVTSDVGDYETVAGIPARVISKRQIKPTS
ncbi:MAG: serine acetyltransferase [Cognatishimia sp.]|uniref:serine O-acetyltransferase n=1 Tax=Cognatishimia sp. TaxID=2211648 RepID=UPI003B8B6944